MIDGQTTVTPGTDDPNHWTRPSGITALIVGGSAWRAGLHEATLRRLCDAPAISIARDAPLDESYDIAVLARSPDIRDEWVGRLADRCATLVVEPPLAATGAEAESITQRLESGRARLVPCDVRRMLPNVRFVAEAAAQATLGELTGATILEGLDSGWPSDQPCSHVSRGRGVLIDPGSHILNLLIEMFPDVRFRRAWIDVDIRRKPDAVEANCVVELDRPNGVVIEVTLSRNRYLSNRATFAFQRGTLTLGVLDEFMECQLAPTVTLRGAPAQGISNSARISDLYDRFYREHVFTAGCGQSPRQWVRIAHLIEEIYRGAAVMERGF